MNAGPGHRIESKDAAGADCQNDRGRKIKMRGAKHERMVSDDGRGSLAGNGEQKKRTFTAAG